MRIARSAGVVLLAALVFAPAAGAGPIEDYQAVGADYRADGDVTACRFTRQRLQNARANTPRDVAAYVPDFLNEVNAEIRRWRSGGCNNPRLASLSLSSSVFRAARSGPAAGARRRRPVGTRVSFRLSEASLVRFTVHRRAKGRRVGGRCVKAKRRNRGRKACIRWVKARGAFKVPAKAGANRFKFRGRIGGRKLKRGRYRLSARATDGAGNRSVLKRKRFRIVR
ncbi:MAG TPA: hypothetical protein VEX39_04645 [Thermoleophilaceae bacterium]|nr:hypothetical protein [Thermoleophilaceae bacterium]